MTGPIGTTSAGEPLAISLDELIGQHLLEIANSGGGKSGLLRKLLEVTHGQVQHIVLDPEDELYTLRERFDYVVAGGDGADAPVTIAGAADLARAVLEHRFSLIVQINDLGDDAPTFVARFLEELMRAPKAQWRPLLVAIDELQRFAPSGPATEASKPVKDLVQRGRKRGFTLLGASTAMTEIDPRVRGLVNNWMLGRVGQALDRNTMAQQLGFTAKEGREQLRGIEKRQFWGMGPAIALEPVLFRVAEVITTPAKSGQAMPPMPPAPEALREILQGLRAEAAEIEDDRAFAQVITELDPDAIVRRDREIEFLKGELARVGQDRDIWRRVADDSLATIQDAITALQSRVFGEDLARRGANMHSDDANMHRGDANSHEIAPVPAKPAPAAKVAPAVAGSTSAPQKAAGAPTPLNQTARDAGALLLAAYPEGLAWNDVLLLIGRRPNSGDSRLARKALIENGLIATADNQVKAAEQLLGTPEISVGHWPGPGELIELWAAKLRGPGGEILRDLDEHGSSHPRAIAARLGKSPTSGWWRQGMKDLKGSNLVREVAGFLELHEHLR